MARCTAVSHETYSSRWAFSPTTCIISGARQSSSSFAAIAAAFSSMQKPFRPSPTPSDAQEFRIITVAVPLAAASRTTRPFVSNVDGKRNRSDLPYHARMISRSEIAPVKKQRSESFRSSA